jgi:hypothetical protein
MSIFQSLFAESGYALPWFLLWGPVVFYGIIVFIAFKNLPKIDAKVVKWKEELDGKRNSSQGNLFVMDPRMERETFLCNHLNPYWNLCQMLSVFPFLFGFVITIINRFQTISFKETGILSFIFGFLGSIFISSLIWLNKRTSIKKIDNLLADLDKKSPDQTGTQQLVTVVEPPKRGAKRPPWL